MDSSDEKPVKVFKPCPSSAERPDLYDDYDFGERDTSSMDYLTERFNKRKAELAAADAKAKEGSPDAPNKGGE